MRVFKTKWFQRYARRQGISDAALCAAVREMANGLVDADLGGGLCKKRIAKPGSGKSGGWRTLVACRLGERAFFLYGFEKSQRDDLKPDEVKAYRDAAGVFLAIDEAGIAKALAAKELNEVECPHAQERSDT